MTETDFKKLFGTDLTDPCLYVASTKSGEKVNAQIVFDVYGLTFLKDWQRVMVFFGKDKHTRELLLQSKVFALSLLSTKQLNLVRQFGFQSGRNKNKFDGVSHTPG